MDDALVALMSELQQPTEVEPDSLDVALPATAELATKVPDVGVGAAHDSDHGGGERRGATVSRRGARGGEETHDGYGLET